MLLERLALSRECRFGRGELSRRKSRRLVLAFAFGNWKLWVQNGATLGNASTFGRFCSGQLEKD